MKRKAKIRADLSRILAFICGESGIGMIFFILVGEFIKSICF